jgi:hypothetical protein
MQNGSLSGFGAAPKYPRSIQRRYSGGSVASASYAPDISVRVS